MAENFNNDNKEGTFHQNQDERKPSNWIGYIIRFIVAAIVLMVTAYLVPGFSEMGFGTALLAALVISLLDWAISRVFGLDASPFGRGISGFLLSALIIYLTQFLVPDMSVNIAAALIAALVIGVINAIIPSKVF